MQAESRRKYRRGIDVAIPPEVAVTGEAGLKTLLRAVPLPGEFSEKFGVKAREHSCYIVAPTYLQETNKAVSNAARAAAFREAASAGTEPTAPTSGSTHKRNSSM